MAPICSDLATIQALATREIFNDPAAEQRGSQAVWLAFRAAQDKAGLDRRFGVHALRHGFCTELVRGNVGVETVRVRAGHEDLRTTQRYLHAERPDLVSAMETFKNASARLASSR